MGYNGTVLRSNGSAWTVDNSVPNETAALWSVWGSGANDIYAVGSQGTIWHSSDGSSWNPEDSGTSVTLYGVWGSGAGDVYAVGGNAALLHSTGKGDWKPVPIDASEMGEMGVTGQLSAVWGSSAEDVYVVGAGGVILHGP